MLLVKYGFLRSLCFDLLACPISSFLSVRRFFKCMSFGVDLQRALFSFWNLLDFMRILGLLDFEIETFDREGLSLLDLSCRFCFWGGTYLEPGGAWRPITVTFLCLTRINGLKVGIREFVRFGDI